MNSQQIKVAQECSELSAAGAVSFGEIVQRLVAAGVERYHADYTRMEMTYYAADGGSHVTPIACERSRIAEAFSAAGVEAAVRRSQRGEIKFPQFTALALEAGCVGYFVQLAGKRVQYFGRRGETHTEWFPGATREP